MRLTVRFAETDQRLPARFGAVQEVTDGDYDKGYDDGYDKGLKDGAAQVDLSDYVKKTDYATSSTPGIVKAVYTHGLSIDPNNGLIHISRANQQEIDGKTSQFRPVTPYDLDYAVKSALSNCKNTEWTEEEKASALNLLGITELVGDINSALEGLHEYAQTLLEDGDI